MSPTHELLRILDSYLEDEIDFAKLANTTKSYKNLLSGLISIDLNSELGREDLYFENGKAIGPLLAFMCVNDMIRTRQFIRGIHKAITKELCTKDTLHVLYAGTGPFAALLLPLLINFRKHNIKYTFLEINPLSIKILRDTLRILGLDSQNISLINQDATKYKIEDPTPDIIISETMQQVLAKEQHVPIYFHLMQQMDPLPVFIPVRIGIHLASINKGIPIEKMRIDDFKNINCVFELSKTSLDVKIREGVKSFKFPKNSVTIYAKTLMKNHLVLITQIQVFEDEIIPINQSSLTLPYSLTPPDQIDRTDLIFESQYVIGEKPELKYRFLPFPTD